MLRAVCAELIALFVLCCLLLMSRSDRQKYGCNLRKKMRREPRWRTKSTTKAKRRLHACTTGFWYLVLRLIPGGALCGSRKAQDNAPRAADAARYAWARKNATETCVKGAARRGPRSFGANIELIIMPRGACAELITLRCAV